MEILIEKAAPGDGADILLLQRSAYLIEAERYNDLTIPPLVETAAEVTSRIVGGTVLKAVTDYSIVGSITGTRTSNDTCLISRLMVDSQYQHQGLGARLLNEIEAHFPEVSRFELFTGHLSDRNIALYRRSGYQEFRREDVSPGITLVYMEKTVG